MRCLVSWVILLLSAFSLSADIEGPMEGLRYPFFSTQGDKFAEIRVQTLSRNFRKLGPLRCRLLPYWEPRQVSVEIDASVCTSEDWKALAAELRTHLRNQAVRDVRWSFRLPENTLSLHTARTWIDATGSIQLHDVTWQDAQTTRHYPTLQIVSGETTPFCLTDGQQTLFPHPALSNP